MREWIGWCLDVAINVVITRRFLKVKPRTSGVPCGVFVLLYEYTYFVATLSRIIMEWQSLLGQACWFGRMCKKPDSGATQVDYYTLSRDIAFYGEIFWNVGVWRRMGPNAE